MEAKTTAKTTLLTEKLETLLLQAAAVASELQGVEQGNETPHYDDIELPAHALGQRLSRMIQSERSCDVALGEATHVVCPDCSRRCKVKTKSLVEIKRRTVTSVDGPLDVTETVAAKEGDWSCAPRRSYAAAGRGCCVRWRSHSNAPRRLWSWRSS